MELLASLRTAVPAAEHPISVDGCEGRPERVKEGKRNLAKYEKQISALEGELYTSRRSWWQTNQRPRAGESRRRPLHKPTIDVLVGWVAGLFWTSLPRNAEQYRRFTEAAKAGVSAIAELPPSMQASRRALSVDGIRWNTHPAAGTRRPASSTSPDLGRIPCQAFTAPARVRRRVSILLWSIGPLKGADRGWSAGLAAPIKERRLPQTRPPERPRLN